MDNLLFLSLLGIQEGKEHLAEVNKVGDI